MTPSRPSELARKAFAGALGPVSAFNPIVTLAERVLGAIGTAAAAALLAAQVVGCCAGVVLVNLMFDLDPVALSARDRASGGLWLGEVVATFGLLVVIFGVVRSGRGSQVGYAVGGYSIAADWFTSSISFAIPAIPAITVARSLPITVARSLPDTFAGIAPGSVASFVLMQLLGGALAVGAVLLPYPNVRGLAGQVANAGTSTRPLSPAPSPASQEA